MLRFWQSLSFNFRLKLGRLVIAVRLKPADIPESEKKTE
jgi:hypothetical protein